MSLNSVFFPLLLEEFYLEGRDADIPLILIAKGPSNYDLIELSLAIHSNSVEPDLTENDTKNDNIGG
jgi:hypothetical protein